jgi:hypothetical protein
MDNTAFEQFIREVRQLWAELRARGCREDHLPAAGESAVAAFEHQFGITLPDNYRRFVRDVSAGGAWLYSLDDHVRGESHKGLPGDPKRPWPHARAWNLPPAEFAAIPDEGADPVGYAAFWQRYFHPDLISGSMPLSDGGCSVWYLLVVTGSERGNVWEDDRGAESGIIPMDVDGRRFTFPEFYLWLLRSLIRCSRAGDQRQAESGAAADRPRE